MSKQTSSGESPSRHGFDLINLYNPVIFRYILRATFQAYMVITASLAMDESADIEKLN